MIDAKFFSSNIYQCLRLLTVDVFLNKPKPIHILTVESSKGDGALYQKILEEPIEGYGLVDLKEDQLLDPVLITNKMMASNMNIGDHYGNKEDSDNESLYVYDAVIAVMDCYLKNKNSFKDFIMYGIIDRDTGGHIIKDKPISMTEMHDGETTILRMCLNRYYHYLSSHKGEIEVAIAKTLEFSYIQGLLEKTSFEYDDSYISNELRKISHLFFITRKMNKVIDLFNSGSSVKDIFIKYVEDKSDLFSDLDKGEYHAFKKAFYLKLENECSFSIKKLVNRWLNDKLKDDDEKNLNNIFIKSNGHLILTLLMSSIGPYLDMKDLMSKSSQQRQTYMLIEILNALNKDDIKDIHKVNPIKDYSSYLKTNYR